MILHKLLGKNKIINLQYIIIEIFLVTGGILLALAINNWNTNRTTNNEVNGYIIEIDKEIKNAIESQEKWIMTYEEMSSNLKRSIKIIQNNDLDSIPTLKKILWPFLTTWPVTYDHPILHEFSEKGYLNNIESIELKTELKRYFKNKNWAEGSAAFNEKQYLDKVETFINKNIEFLEIGEQEFLVKNDILDHPRIKTDFKRLFNDLEFWNILILKTETILREEFELKRFHKNFKSLSLELEKYIDERNLNITTPKKKDVSVSVDSWITNEELSQTPSY